MSAGRRDRGWIAVLGVLGVLVAGCTVAYLAAPFETPPAERVDRTSEHVVAPEHRIVAVRDDGSLQVIDARDGTVSETILGSGLADVEAVDTGHHRETAYVAAGGSIRLIRLRTGDGETLARGRAPAVGPLAFPQIDPDIDRPEVDQLAFVRRRDGVDTVVVENLVTGSRSVLDAGGGDQPFSTIEGLTWGTGGNRLYGIADGGRVLFRIEADRADSLAAAVVSEPLPAGSRWVDLAAGGTGAVGILATGERTALVEIDARRLAPGTALHRAPPSVELEAVEADPSAGQYLLTTASGELLRFAPDAGDGPTQLATGVVRAAW